MSSVVLQAHFAKQFALETTDVLLSAQQLHCKRLSVLDIVCRLHPKKTQATCFLLAESGTKCAKRSICGLESQ